MLIECYYLEKKDNKYISILEDFCDDNRIDLNLFETKLKGTPRVVFCDDFGIEILSFSGAFTRAKLKEIYNEALY